MADTDITEAMAELLGQMNANPGFADGGIAQPAQDDDDSVPAILSPGCVFFVRTGEDRPA